MTALMLAPCPLCQGQGLGSYPSNSARKWPCPLCDPEGRVPSEFLPLLARLSDHMHHVANAMQRSDADEAARLTRVTARVAETLLQWKR